MKVSRPAAIVALLTIVLFVLGLMLVVERSKTTTYSPAPTPSPSSASNGSNTNNDTVNDTYSYKVYFSRHPESDDDPTKTFAVNRVAPDTGLGVRSIQDLIAGPHADEGNYFTQVIVSGSSNCDGKDFTLAISGGTATLQFCRDFAAKGVVSDGQAKSEIDTTLKQFPTITKVISLNKNGHCLFDASGQDLCKQ